MYSNIYTTHKDTRTHIPHTWTQNTYKYFKYVPLDIPISHTHTRTYTFHIALLRQCTHIHMHSKHKTHTPILRTYTHRDYITFAHQSHACTQHTHITLTHQCPARTKKKKKKYTGYTKHSHTHFTPAPTNSLLLTIALISGGRVYGGRGSRGRHRLPSARPRCLAPRGGHHTQRSRGRMVRWVKGEWSMRNGDSIISGGFGIGDSVMREKLVKPSRFFLDIIYLLNNWENNIVVFFHQCNKVKKMLYTKKLYKNKFWLLKLIF